MRQDKRSTRFRFERRTNPMPLMSAMGQKRTFRAWRDRLRHEARFSMQLGENLALKLGRLAQTVERNGKPFLPATVRVERWKAHRRQSLMPIRCDRFSCLTAS